MTNLIDDIKRDREAGTMRPTRYDGYLVDDAGDVWSLHKWRGTNARVLKSHPNSHGYHTVKVKYSGGTKKLMIHTAVCEAFHGPKPTPHHQVCHKDGTRTNNRADNLRWGTAKDNAEDRAKHGNTRNQNSGKTHCIRGHAFSVHGRSRPGGGRECRVCQIQHKRDYRTRKALEQGNE